LKCEIENDSEKFSRLDLSSSLAENIWHDNENSVLKILKNAE
jgi:hypothetical protein